MAFREVVQSALTEFIAKAKQELIMVQDVARARGEVSQADYDVAVRAINERTEDSFIEDIVTKHVVEWKKKELEKEFRATANQAMKAFIDSFKAK